MKKIKSKQHNSYAGSDPRWAAGCPLCQERGQYNKYLGFDLYDHLNSDKHTKSSLAGFLSQEAAYKRFWDGEIEEW